MVEDDELLRRAGARRVLGHVGQRLLRDSVKAEARRGREAPRIALSLQVYVEPRFGVGVHQAGDVTGAGQGRGPAIGLVSLEQADGAADVGQALAAQLLGRGQRLGRLLRIALEDVPRPGQVQHGHGQRVGDHVVDLTRDPAPLLHRRLPSQIGLDGAQLGEQAALGRQSGRRQPTRSHPQYPGQPIAETTLIEPHRGHQAG